MQAGDHVGTQVELERPLAEGGMGTLWVGRHRALETQVAVKFLSPEFATNEEAVARFRREAATAAKVRSPHIVQQLDHGIASDGAPFIVMELLDGNDLATLLTQGGGTMQSTLVLELMKQTCRALSAAHEAAVVHRDIKPANIFVIDNGGEPFVKLLDFGIARDPDFRNNGLTQTDVLMGTAPYMSPEQLFNTALVDERTDLWAIAVVTYQCLTGKLPFGEDALPSISLAVGKRDYEPPSRVAREMPPALDAWFARAFAEALADRFQSARELSDSLASALAVSYPSAVALAGGNSDSAPWTANRVATAATEPAPPMLALPEPRAVANSDFRWPLPAWVMQLIAAMCTLFAVGVLFIYLRWHAASSDAEASGDPHATRVVSRVAKPKLVLRARPHPTNSPNKSASGSPASGATASSAQASPPQSKPSSGDSTLGATGTAAGTATTRAPTKGRSGPDSVSF